MAQLFIGGKWHAASRDETIPVVSPVDGKPFETIARAREEDVDRAVAAAQSALAGPWGWLPAFERGRILSRLAARISERAEQLAQLEARDTGKPISTARNDMQVLARYF